MSELEDSPRPLPSEPPDESLVDHVANAIGNAAAQADLSLEGFWDCFSGGDPAFCRWKSQGKMIFTERLIAMFQGERSAAGFLAGKSATWDQLRAPLLRGRHLVTRLEAYRARLAQWERADRARKAAERADEDEIESAATLTKLGVAVAASGSAADGMAGEGRGIRELTKADFDPISAEALADSGWRFLCGDPPNPVTAIHAAVRRTEVDAIVANCREPGRVVILHGPVGEGSSTAVLQATYEEVCNGRRALRIRSPMELEQVGSQIGSTARWLVVIDDANELREAPRWIDQLLDSGGTLLLGTQTRRINLLEKLFDARTVRKHTLGRVSTDDASPYIDAIDRFAPEPDAGRRQRFLDGLNVGHGLGGLWPAQFQATRGEALDHRVRAVVTDFDDDLLRMLSSLVFSGWVHDRDRRVHEPSWSRVIDFYSRLSLRPDLQAQTDARLQKVVRALDGEFFARRSWTTLSSANDPPLTLRHPAVTESLFRWLFGAKDDARGEYLFDKWEYLTTGVDQAAAMKDGNAAFALVQLIARSHHYDFRYGPLKRRLLESPLANKVGDILLFAIDLAYSPASEFQRRRLDIERARVWAFRPWGRRAEPAEQSRALERATVAATSAWSSRDFVTVCDAALVFDELETHFVFGDRSYSGLEMLSAVERWEKPKGGKPSTVSCSRMKLLAETKTYLADEVSKASAAASLLTWSGWDDERLKILGNLINCARRSRLRMGSPSEPFGLSLRSIYAAFLKELAHTDRRFAARKVDSLYKKGRLSELVHSLLRKWVDDESQHPEPCWPDGLVDRIHAVIDSSMAKEKVQALLVCAEKMQLGADAPTS